MLKTIKVLYTQSQENPFLNDYIREILRKKEKNKAFWREDVSNEQSHLASLKLEEY